MNRNLWLACLLMLPTLLAAQDAKLGNWIINFNNFQLSPKLNLHLEWQLRSYNLFGDLEQALFRTGLGYNLSEANNNVLMGYAFVFSESYIDDTTKYTTYEHRTFQQFITRQNLGRLGLQHRYRLEERFLPIGFRMRARYFLSINIPLNHKEMSPNTLYLSAYDEIFLRFERNAFDRNRIFAGLGYKFNKHVRLEIGYMNQYLPTYSRDQLNITLFNNF